MKVVLNILLIILRWRRVELYTLTKIKTKAMRTLFTLVAVLITSVSFAQLQVKQTSPKQVIGNIKAGGVLHCELAYRIDGDMDTVYTIMFKDAGYSALVDYKSVSFNSDGNTLNELYNVIKSVFSEENKKNKDYKVQFTLGDTDVIVSNWRSMGITGAMFFTKGGYTVIGEKQLDKLFGK